MKVIKAMARRRPSNKAKPFFGPCLEEGTWVSALDAAAGRRHKGGEQPGTALTLHTQGCRKPTSAALVHTAVPP